MNVRRTHKYVKRTPRIGQSVQLALMAVSVGACAVHTKASSREAAWSAEKFGTPKAAADKPPSSRLSLMAAKRWRRSSGREPPRLCK